MKHRMWRMTWSDCLAWQLWTRMWGIVFGATCWAFLLVPVQAAPLKVVGATLQDAHGNALQLRGVNVPVYKSGWADDLDAVAQAVATTKANAVRLSWWATPPDGAPYFTVNNLDRAIQAYRNLGIVPVVALFDLTYQYGHNDPPGGARADGNDRTLFANTITAYWTRPDVLAVLRKHQDNLIVNLANEWGSSQYSNGTSAADNFIQNYTTAIQSLRNAGITVPLMVDAPKGFEHQLLLDRGAELVAADPQRNTLLSVHTYWAASDPTHTDTLVAARLDALKASQLPWVLGEVSSRAWTTVPCDPVHHDALLTKANQLGLGYLFWAWYEDGQCGQAMNITVGTQGNGVTLPTAPGFGHDALYAPAYGISTASPTTRRPDLSPLGHPTQLNATHSYSVTSDDDHITRPATALVTRLDNLGADKRPVVVFLPGWGGTGDVAAARNAQTALFVSQGNVVLDVGFHQTTVGVWYSDLAESVLGALNTLCQASYADCGAVLLAGTSFGGTQTHPVVRYLRAIGVFDGSGGANAGRKVRGILAQDAGYTLHWSSAANADATAYSIAMIENLGDQTFPVNTCDWGNCGARNRADHHQTAPGSQYVLSMCPPGGGHGSRGYADWDNWVLSAAKTMLHTQRGVAKFTGYVEPALPVSNACATQPASLPDLVLTQLVAPATGQLGTEVSASTVVSNQGAAPAAPGQTTFYLSTDATISVGDIDTQAGCATPGLAPGDSFTCQTSVLIPASLSAGSYYLGAIADATAQITEANEANNARAAAAPTVVTAPPRTTSKGSILPVLMLLLD